MADSSSADKPLRWGICSAGRISNDFCIGLLSDPDNGHKIMAVAARDLKKAKTFASERQIPKAYGSYEELGKDSELDVIYVSVINSEHLKVVKMLLNYNKNILCEKPLGMNYRETEEMIKLANQKGVFFMEGTIGDVKLVISSFGSASGPEMQRLYHSEIGGGCMMDKGVYCIAFSQMVFGEMPKKITPIGFLNENGVDELDSVTFEYSGQRMAVFQVAFTTEVPREGIVCGTKGIIKIHPPFWCSDKIQINGVLMEKPFPPEKGKPVYDSGVGFLYEANEVKRCIQAGLKESPLVTHKDTLTFAKLIEECRKIIGVKFPQD